MAEKQRLDLLLVERGLETSRERAKAVIMSGVVYVNNQKADKAGLFCGPDDQVEVRGPALQYVSRGGLKIEKALDYFAYDPAGQSFIDIGASTGGFTDCLLRRGAAQGFAVDVGYGQLAWQVRTDPRVTVMERTNIRQTGGYRTAFGFGGLRRVLYLSAAGAARGAEPAGASGAYAHPRQAPV